MKVGITPLEVQVPEMAPIRNRISMAEVTSATFSFMACSKRLQGVLKNNIESAMQSAELRSRTTWLAPRMESLP